ncbi:uncharacterized protein METZ01_LOCUS350054, partial [marine metagenome]
MKVAHVHGVLLLLITLLGSRTVFGNTYVAPEGPAQEINEIRPLKAVLKDAKAIDAILTKGYAKYKVNPLPLVDDATFVRRSYLQVGGRIPTY